MVSTVKSWPNHYDTLGIRPEASGEEIGRAFASRMFSPHGMAVAAQIGMAYEVLRNPAKRKAYDEQLGIGRAAPPPVAPAAVSFRISARVAGGPVEPQVEARSRNELPSERAVGSFIAEALRVPAAPAAAVPARPPEPRAREWPPAASAAGLSPPPPLVRASRLPEAEAGETGINRSALTIGAVMLAVVTIGAWAGLEAGNPGGAESAKTISTALPKAKPLTSAVAAADAPREIQARSSLEPRSFASLRTRRVRAPAKAAPSSEQMAEAGQAPHHSYYETTAADGTPEIAVAGDPAAAQAETATPAVATAASLPLSDRTVARTIERIGYRCGQVVGTSHVEGEASGVFKVVCSSGQSYQAKPVRGRYRFGRWKGE